MKSTMIIDFSSYLHASFHVARYDKDISSTEERNQYWKSLLVGMILNVKKLYKPDEVILAIDSPNSHRKLSFKYYKARRILKKEDSDIDFDEFNRVSNIFLDEIKTNLPVKVVKTAQTEADDIIGILTSKLREHDITIVSRDKDFTQLLKFPNVKIHNPMDNKLIVCDNPHEFLVLHILGGDSGDDVPNILSPDDIFVTTGKRQKSITKGIIKEVLEDGLDKFVIKNNLIANYERNRNLVELSEEIIPQDLQTEIMYAYNNAKVKADFEDMVGYLARNNFTNLINNL